MEIAEEEDVSEPTRLATVSLLLTQHSELVQVTNDFLDTMELGMRPDSIRKALTAFQTHFQHHLPYEERLMVQAGYPLASEHIGRHQKMMNEFNNLHKNIKSENATQQMGFLLILLIYQWITQHMMQDDREFEDYFRNKVIRILP